MKFIPQNFIGEWANVLLTIRIHPNQTENPVMHGDMETVSNSDPTGMLVNHI
jgi:hypothetical protein